MRPTIAIKLLALVGVAVVALALSATTGLVALRRLAAAGEGIYDRGVTGLSGISDIAVAVERQSALVGRAPSELNLEVVTKYRSEFARHAADVSQRVAALERAGLEVRRQHLIEEFGAARGAFEGEADKVFAFASSFAQEQAVKALQGDFATAEARVKQTLAQLVAETQAMARTDVSGMQASARRTGTLLLACAALLAVVVVVSSLVIGRSITRPLKRTVAVLDAVAQGDFSQSLDVRSRDEIGQMAHALNAAVAAIGEALDNVNHAAAHVAVGAREVSSASEHLSVGAQEQASSLEETSASLEELAGSVRHNSESGRRASQLSGDARGIADTGGTVVHQAVDAMEDIKRASKKIGDITTLIDGVAFQTNLLALNAAVEAARAGEQGRGFAVVASEVRNLAQRASAAASEINGLIEDSVRKVEGGSLLVTRSGETLSEIVRSVKGVADIVAEMACASQEQTKGIDRVSQAVVSMDRVVQSHAAQTEQLSSTAQSLAAQAADLQRLVARFRIHGSEPTERPQDDAIPPAVPTRGLVSLAPAEMTTHA